MSISSRASSETETDHAAARAGGDAPAADEGRHPRPADDDNADDDNTRSDPLERSQRLNRFVILDRLGQGGMGVVYSAYDPKLDRRVAVKLLRSGGKGRNSAIAHSRLVREARALARLSHPNVVPVYEVGVIDGQVFVVMEFVAGQSLRRWTESGVRSWREILAIYCQAGAGLAAAHRLGVIHRDFKPDNAIVGEDMRVRVIDFGLARAFHDTGEERDDDASDERDDKTDRGAALRAGRKPDDPTLRKERARTRASERPYEKPVSAFASTLGRDDAGETHAALPAHDRDQTVVTVGSSLTTTQAVVGTPGYISPEQYAGSRVDHATDQFSFCVSLFEALYGRRPFAGASMAQVYDSMLAGRVRTPGKQGRVPGWIQPVLCRGLAVKPEDRYPSMQALLSALTPRASRTRWWLAAALVVLLSVAGGAVLLRSSPAQVPLCAGGEDEIAAVWTWQRRQAVRSALLDPGSAYAREVWTRVEITLDGYAADWAAMHWSACVAHQRGEQSDRLLDHRMRCLDRRRAAMDSAVTVLGETTAESLTGAVDLVQHLPDIATCADLDALMTDVPAPASAQVAAQVAAVHRRLVHVEALEHSGRYQDALDAVAAVVSDAEALDYRPLLAEALLVHGRILIEFNNRHAAVDILDRAARAALATGMDALAVDALARLIYAQGTQPTQDGDALAVARFAEALSERAPQNAFSRALLLNNIAVVYMARGQPERARDYFERALAVKNSGGEGQLELVHILENLARLTPDPQRRRALMGTALRELQHELGPSHPKVLFMSVLYSRQISHLHQARDLLEQACARYERFHPGLVDKRTECEGLLGLLHGDLGDRKQAVLHLTRADELSAAFDGRWWEGVRGLMRGYFRYYQGDHQAALVEFERALEIYGNAAEKWWWRVRAAEAQLGIGLTHLASGRREKAVVALDAALAIFDDLGDLHRDAVLERQQALARVSLARALSSRNSADTCARALELLDRARVWYEGAGPGLETSLDEIARWRRDHLSACSP